MNGECWSANWIGSESTARRRKGWDGNGPNKWWTRLERKAREPETCRHFPSLLLTWRHFLLDLRLWMSVCHLTRTHTLSMLNHICEKLFYHSNELTLCACLRLVLQTMHWPFHFGFAKELVRDRNQLATVFANQILVKRSNAETPTLDVNHTRHARIRRESRCLLSEPKQLRRFDTK